MSKINIKCPEATAAVNQMSTVQGNINRYSQQVTSVINTLRQDGSETYATLCTKLQTVNDSLLQEAAKMGTLAEALQYIVGAYAQAENKILGLAVTDAKRVGGNSNAANFQAILSQLTALLNWEEEEEKKAPELMSVSHEQEKAHDLYMQNEIFALLETDAYSKETWANATEAQRMDILRSFMKDLSNIYGVQLSSEVKFEAINDTARGYYLAGANTVTINSNYIGRADSYQIMQTMVHEMRHAYQHAAVDHPESFQVSPETIAQWKDNFAQVNYINYDGTNYGQYVSQPVEWDAKNFAKQYTDLSQATPEYRGSWD